MSLTVPTEQAPAAAGRARTEGRPGAPGPVPVVGVPGTAGVAEVGGVAVAVGATDAAGGTDAAAVTGAEGIPAAASVLRSGGVPRLIGCLPEIAGSGAGAPAQVLPPSAAVAGAAVLGLLGVLALRRTVRRRLLRGWPLTAARGAARPPDALERT